MPLEDVVAGASAVFGVGFFRAFPASDPFFLKAPGELLPNALVYDPGAEQPVSHHGAADFAPVGKFRDGRDSLAEWCSKQSGDGVDFGGGQKNLTGDIVAEFFDGRFEARTTDTRDPKP